MESQEMLNYMAEQFEIGNYGRVERTANKMLELDDETFLYETYHYKSLSFWHQGRYEEAIACLEEALQALPEHYNLTSLKIQIHIALGDFVPAQNHVDALLEANPNDIDQLYASLSIAEKLKEDLGVIEMCQRILELEPDSLNTMIIMSNSMRELSRFDECLEVLEKASKLPDMDDIDRSIIENNIGYTYSRQERWGRSQTTLRKVHHD